MKSDKKLTADEILKLMQKHSHAKNSTKEKNDYNDKMADYYYKKYLELTK